MPGAANSDGDEMKVFDLDSEEVRGLNGYLHGEPEAEVTVENPAGKHSVAVGVDAPVDVRVHGHVGYYCAGMNKQASVSVKGNAGPGVAENMMSGRVDISGNASQYAGASAHGGLLVIRGDASSRCGISMKGVDIVVGGDVGHLSAFMAQKGHLVVCGDAGDHLGDSLYEAVIYVRGSVGELGADCVEKPMDDGHRQKLGELLSAAGLDHDPAEFKRYGSARRLYHFNIDNADAY